MACNPRVKGERKQAHRLNTEIVFLPQNSCARVRRLAAERNRGAAEHRAIWNSIHLTLCVQSRKNQTPLRNRQRGPRRNHSQGRFDAFRFLCDACCLATVLVGLTSKYKKAMRAYFRNGLKMESYVTDTLHWKNLLLK